MNKNQEREELESLLEDYIYSGGNIEKLLNVKQMKALSKLEKTLNRLKLIKTQTDTMWF